MPTPSSSTGRTAIVFIYGPTCVVESAHERDGLEQRAPAAASVFEAALEVHPDIVLIHDEERILFANAACRRFLAAEAPEDLEGRPIDVIVHPDALRRRPRTAQVLISSARARFEDMPLKLVCLDGRDAARGRRVHGRSSVDGASRGDGRRESQSR